MTPSGGKTVSFDVRVFDASVPLVDELSVGDVVYCRRQKRRGRLVSKSTTPDNKNQWQILFDGSTNPQPLSSRSKPVPIVDRQTLPSTPLLVLCHSTNSYRQCVAAQVASTDHVLEVGCSTGATSQIVASKTASLVCFDTSPNMVATTQAAVPIADCYCIDALSDPLVAAEHCRKSGRVFTVILIDIGGNRELEAVIRMLEWVQAHILPIEDSSSTVTAIASPQSLPLIIVKSEALTEAWQSQAAPSASQTDSNSLKFTSEPKMESTSELKDTRVKTWWNTCLEMAHSSSQDCNSNATNNALTSATESVADTHHPKRRKIRHPLQAPCRMVPDNNKNMDGETRINTNDDDPGRVICRYHNYHPRGCARFNQAKENATGDGDNEKRKECPYDHTHCHACLQAGHIARYCPLLK
jgi:SAM-dependent methyltransferase